MHMLIKRLINTGIERNISIELLERGKYQPRIEFNVEALQELAESIKEVGILNRIIVRPINHGKHEIIAGERRWRAAQLAGLQEVPCKIILCDDEQALQVALIENLARKDLNAIEEARGIQRLIDEFGYKQKDLPESLGKSRPTITNLLRLLELHPKVQMLLLENKLTESHGKILLGLMPEKQYAYALETISKRWSIRQLDHIIKNDEKRKKSVTVSTFQNADTQRLERMLCDYLGAAVSINGTSKNTGFLKIAYNSFEELEGILQRIGWTGGETF